ncbi:MAG TPA: glycine cleavage system protein GcvH [Terriglobia bacterium]|nr:glycine cleavage system protein GcvH [Terriglobia bacterium]
MPEETLKVAVDKFTFLIPTGLSYTDAGFWVALEGGRARLGLSDFAQQQSGDVAFVRIKPVGTSLESGDEFAEIETVKVNVSIISPVKGTILEINTSLEENPELINQAPYGAGWLAVVELTDWEDDRQHLLGAEAYAALVKEQAEAEAKQ